MLSIRGMNFCAYSASGKMWTFLHVQSMLSIRGMNFIAHWAYGELISSRAEHTGNRFHRMLSMRGNVKKSNISAESNTIFKNLVLQALGTIRFRFLQKKSKKKISCLCTFKGWRAYVKTSSESICVVDRVSSYPLEIFFRTKPAPPSLT